MRRAARVDANQRAIVDALRLVGASVAVTSAIGDGFPDLVVGYRGHNLLLELKDQAQPPSKRKLTPDQVAFAAAWRGQVETVSTFDEALNLLRRLEWRR